MPNKWKKDAKLHLCIGKGDLRHHYLLIRNSTAVVFELDRKVHAVVTISDPTVDSHFYETYLKDFSDRWRQIQFDPDLINKFIIRMEYYILFQKEFEYLGFFLPMPRVIFKGAPHV